MMDLSDLTRHDVPPAVQHVITTAVASDVVDAIDTYVLGMCYGGDWRNLIRELCVIAFSGQHVDKSKHRAVVRAADKFWKNEMQGA